MQTVTGTVTGVTQLNAGDAWMVTINVPILQQQYNMQSPAIQMTCGKGQANAMMRAMLNGDQITLTIPFPDTV
jgi:hypothetical protein